MRPVWLVIVVVLAWLSMVAAAPAWTTSYGGVTGNRSSDTDVGLAPDVAWTSAPFAGNNVDSPIVTDETQAYTAGQVGGGQYAVRAIGLSTGVTSWQVPAPAPAPFFLASASVGGGILFVSGGTVSAAYDTTTGSLRWSLPTQTRSSLIAGGAVVRVPTGGTTLTAHDAVTGAVRWQVDLGSSPSAAPVLAGSRVVVRTADNRYRAYDSATGALAWSFTFAGASGLNNEVEGSLVAEGSTVFGLDSRGGLIAFSAANGSTLWSKDNVVGRGTLVVDGTRLYLSPVLLNMRVTAYDRASGAQLWTGPLNGLEDRPIRADGRLYIKTLGVDAATGATISTSARRREVLIGDRALSWEDGGTVVRAFADLTAPSLAVTPLPAASSERRPTITWSSEDDAGSGLAGFDVLVDGTAVASGLGAAARSFTLASDLADGPHTLQVRARDRAGNERMSSSVAYFVDVTAPSAPGLATPAPAAANLAPVTNLTWSPAGDGTGSGVGSYRVFIDGSQTAVVAAETCASTCTAQTPALGHGQHTWRVDSVDRAGNTAASTTRSFTVDAIAPSAPGPIQPGDGGRVSDATPTFTWTASSDADSGLAGYRVVVDGQPSDVPGSVTSFTPGAALAEGAHSWKVVAVDAAGNVADSPTRGFNVDSVGPAAALIASESLISTGGTVRFDASGSRDPLDPQLVSYAFDLDGDGTFERGPGPEAAVTETYDAPGTYVARVRVTNSAGATAIAQAAPVEVRLTPPYGRLGITINNGDRFTNDADVVITAVWPTLAARMLISNDGGFGDPFEGAVAAQTDWTLDSSGPERLAKTVYVRFEGGESGRETYQDDIILDETAPTVAARVASVERRSFRLAIKAKDRVSGVARMQVTDAKRRPGRLRAYKRKASLRTRKAKAFVRVRDRAGNVSRWRTVKLR